jgi:dolichol-phosphate mannosyltransferase
MMFRQACAWYCGVLLWMSGTQHLANKYVIFGTILEYQIVTPSLAVATASVLPWLHLMLAAVLIAPGVRSKTPFITTALLGVVFVVVQSIVLLRGIPVDCGCFGAMVDRPVGVASLGIASSLMLTGFFGAWLTPNTSVREVREINAGSIGQDMIGQFRHESVDISIIMPVYNERDTIHEVVAKVQKVATSFGWDWELLIVDDGSTDGTHERLKEIAIGERIHVLTHPFNRGKGAAIRTGLARAVFELTVIQDADLEYDPGQIGALIEAKSRMRVDVVYGSRVLGAEAGMSKKRMNVYAIGVGVLNFAVRVIYGLQLTDEATCYKLFLTSDLRRMDLQCEGFEFCPEVTAKASRLGLSLIEVPISYQPRSSFEGKKIRLRDAVTAIGTLWKFRQWTAPNV